MAALLAGAMATGCGSTYRAAMNDMQTPGPALLHQRLAEAVAAQEEAIDRLREARQALTRHDAEGGVAEQSLHRANVAVNEAELAAWHARRHAASVRDVERSMREAGDSPETAAELEGAMAALERAGNSVGAAAQACREWALNPGESGPAAQAAGMAIARAEADVEAALASASAAAH